MAIFKCKMCGGNLEITEGQSVCTCEYCGTEQTLPRLDSDRKANLYDRANHFRRNNDFDKAMGIYEQILNEDNTDAEAYWSLVLCRYGIEYVEDPSTHKRIPTINRAQYTSIYADENYKAALEHAAIAQKIVYEQEAKTIDEIQKGILAISEKEEPFDVFICYKESDETGRRTPDSVLANDLYHQLTQEGFKVFFARITLEDKLGQEYEPYIFAALNSAKVMVVLGTKPEYFRAVWVKNEWARYLSLIRGGAKKMLIPAYKDMDPYDLPEEFSHLQAQDMTKLGFMQDLIRGIKKIIGTKEDEKTVKETVVVQQTTTNSNIVALLKRGNMALEDEEWDKADGFFEEVLNQDAECAEAYLGLLLVEKRVSSKEKLQELSEEFSDNLKYQKVKRFGTTELVKELENYNEIAKCEKIYQLALSALSNEECDEAIKLLESIENYKDAREKLTYAKEMEQKCDQNAEVFEDFIAVIANKSRELSLLYLTREYDSLRTEMERINETLDLKRKQKENKEQELKGQYASNAATEKEISDIKNRVSDIDLKIRSTESDISNLGLFASKKKNELRSQIDELICERDKLNRTITSLDTKISVRTVEEINLEIAKFEEEIKSVIELIDNKTEEIGKIEGELQEMRDFPINNTQRSYEEVVSILQNDAYLREHFKKKEERYYKRINISFADKYDVTNFGFNDWIVLERINNKVKLMSKNCVSEEPYNAVYEEVTWATCSLREWLNEDFYSSLYYPYKALITDKVPAYNDGKESSVSSVGEKITMLTAEEAKELPKELRVACDEYDRPCLWWLKDSDDESTAIGKFMQRDGTIRPSGFTVDREGVGVRPVLWVDLSCLEA